METTNSPPYPLTLPNSHPSNLPTSISSITIHVSPHRQSSLVP